MGVSSLDTLCASRSWADQAVREPRPDAVGGRRVGGAAECGGLVDLECRSEPDVDACARVRAREGWRGDFGEPVEPSRLVRSGGPSQQRRVPGEACGGASWPSSASSASTVRRRESGQSWSASHCRRWSTSGRSSSRFCSQPAILASALRTSSVKRSIWSRTDVFSLRPWRRSWESGPSSLEALLGRVRGGGWPSTAPSWLMRGRVRLAGRPGRRSGGRCVQQVPQGGLFGEEPFDVAGGVVDGEAGVGLAAEGVEDFSFGGALVGEDAAVVDLGEAGDVPGVGGVAAAALAGVAGEALQGGGAEEVDLGPGAALDAVDGAGPGVGAVGAAVAAAAGDEGSGQRDGRRRARSTARSPSSADGGDGERRCRCGGAARWCGGCRGRGCGRRRRSGVRRCPRRARPVRGRRGGRRPGGGCGSGRRGLRSRRGRWRGRRPRPGRGWRCRRTTASARASRVAWGEPRSCSQPWSRRMAWLVATRPAR